ncbi:MAG: hypothetical protein HUJ29_13120 [Gammaproteobacteria bacterium]|nr:hypothetical protein [Gammaproteobacteria bacterium]
MKSIRTIVLAMCTLMMSVPVQADELLKPFILAEKSAGDVAEKLADTKGKLIAAGFEIAGQYSPYEGVTIVVFTNDVLKTVAGASEYGAYAAAQRVSLTQYNGEIQVAYTNPEYAAHAFRLDQNLREVRQTLAVSLGDQGQFGPEKGLSKEQLREYHYKFMMPYVDDIDELKEYDSYEQAVSAVEKALASNKGGVSKVYSINLPGDKTLFGVAMTEGQSSDEYIMSEIDFKELRSSAHLPYELLVDGDEVVALNAKFRIAINFPDLSMMGANSFMNIMSSPTEIKEALTWAAGGEVFEY